MIILTRKKKIKPRYDNSVQEYKRTVLYPSVLYAQYALSLSHRHVYSSNSLYAAAIHARTITNIYRQYKYNITRSPSSVSMNILPLLVVHDSRNSTRVFVLIIIYVRCTVYAARACIGIPFVFDYGGGFFSSKYIDTPYTYCRRLPSPFLVLRRDDGGQSFFIPFTFDRVYVFIYIYILYIHNE